MAALIRLSRAVALAVSMAVVSAYGSLPTALPAKKLTPIDRVVPRPLSVPPDVAKFYRERGYRPLWIEGSRLRPEAAQILALDRSDALRTAMDRASNGEPYALTHADLLLTQAFADHFRKVHAPASNDRMYYVDSELRPRSADVSDALEALSTAPDLSAHLKRTTVRNPAFDGLTKGLETYRRTWSLLPQIRIDNANQVERLKRRLGAIDALSLERRLKEFQQVHGLAPSGRPDAPTLLALNRGAPHFERVIELNIDRARAIPATPAGRYVIVDTASARLWMIEDGRIQGQMRVVVGKRSMRTPVMSGLMRHVVLNPYWNLPPDLIRQRARTASRRGPSSIRAEGMEVLSDWSESARKLDPTRVDWSAVAAGRSFVNLRQLPGRRNMMGKIKFMFPNELGIYLHDTPQKEDFARADRRLSSGCVRVEDPDRLAAWLFAGRAPQSSGAPEEEVDLPEPVPVYLAYFTALPTRDGVRFQTDSYGLDRIRQGSARNL